MKLCLDSLTLNNTEPVELIRAAKSAGFDMVSLWVQPQSVFPLQLVTPAKLSACQAALAETGIQVGPLEVFNLTSAEVIESYRPALALGAQLGAKSATAINIRHTDLAAVSALFAQFAALAGEFGLGVNLEPLARFATATLAQARDIVRESGVKAILVLDALHLVRAGGSAADVRALGPGVIGHIQLCDGTIPDSEEHMRQEAAFDRLYPGDGDFGLVDLLRDAPMDVSWGIEAPNRLRAASGKSAESLAQEAIAAMRRTIDKIKAAKSAS